MTPTDADNTVPRLGEGVCFRQYTQTALWSSLDDDDGKPLDANYTTDDIHPDTLAVMRADCRRFLELTEHLPDLDPEDAGHDFWLTRNRHGAGFWDGDYPDTGEELTDLAHGFGEYTLYVSDGVVYGCQ